MKFASAPQVVVGFNGSPAGHDALRLGVVLARWAGAELVVACVFPPESLAGVPFEPRATRVAAGDHRIFVRQDAEAVLSEAREKLPRDMDFTLEALEGDSPVRALRRAALSRPADLLVVGATHRGRLKQRLRRTMAQALLQDAPIALAVAPRGFAETDEAHVRSRSGAGARSMPRAA